MPPFIPSTQIFQKQQPEPSKSTSSVHKLPTRLTPSGPLAAAFKPPKLVEQPEAPKLAAPVAVRWLRLQRDYYRKFIVNVKEFMDNPENNELRRIIKMEVGNSVDKALQKRPSDGELTKSLAEFSEYLNRFLSGETMTSTLMPNKTFTFDQKCLNFLIHTISVRIIVSFKLHVHLKIYCIFFSGNGKTRSIINRCCKTCTFCCSIKTYNIQKDISSNFNQFNVFNSANIR